MSTLCEASLLIRQIGGEGQAKAVIRRAHTRLQTWTHNRVKDIYFAERRVRVWGDEIDALRAVANAKKQEEAASDPNISELRAAFAILAGRMAKIDPDFYDPAIEAICRAASQGGDSSDELGGKDSGMDQE
ncbi:MAG: hypothetical protein ACREC9_15670 [Methylocella sp.]